MNVSGSSPKQTGIFALVVAATIAIMVVLTLMAGLPPAENLTGFTIGVIVVLIITAAIGGLGWYLLIKPLPEGLAVGKPLEISATTRSIIAILLSLSALSTGLAGVWDEIWHSKYGIPFGEDFFWRPHLLLYFSFGTMVILGGWSWWTLMTRAKGTLQQKFQANPLLGFSFISGLFTLYAIITDPIWHSFYGEDLSPWSLPHLFVLLLILVMGLLATAYHKTLMSAQTWQIGFRNFTWRNILILLVFVGGMLDFLLLFTVQWYSANNADPAVIAVAGSGANIAAIQAVASANDNAAGLLLQIAAYPDWLLPLFMTFMATFFGALGLHCTRQVGSATLVGLITFAIRWVMDSSFASPGIGTLPLYMMLPSMVVLDILYAFALKRTGKPPVFWLSSLVTAAVLTLFTAILLSALFPFTTSPLSVIPARLFFNVIAAMSAIWLAQTIGGLSGEASQTDATAITVQTRRVTALVYSGFSIFLLFFIVTATPPV